MISAVSIPPNPLTLTERVRLAFPSEECWRREKRTRNSRFMVNWSPDWAPFHLNGTQAEQQFIHRSIWTALIQNSSFHIQFSFQARRPEGVEVHQECFIFSERSSLTEKVLEKNHQCTHILWSQNCGHILWSRNLLRKNCGPEIFSAKHRRGNAKSETWYPRTEEMRKFSRRFRKIALSELRKMNQKGYPAGHRIFHHLFIHTGDYQKHARKVCKLTLWTKQTSQRPKDVQPCLHPAIHKYPSHIPRIIS